MRITMAIDTSEILKRFEDGSNFDWTEPLNDIADDFELRHIPDTFKAHGPGWAPLSPRYAAWKAQHYPGAPILVRTGTLFNSLISGPGHVREVSANELLIGSTVPYASYHQTGTSRMPARPPMVITPEIRFHWIEILGQYFRRKLKVAA